MKKSLTLFILSLFTVVLFAIPAFAEEKNEISDRQKVLLTPAYFSNEPGENYNEQLADKYLKMSDREFKMTVKKNLKMVQASIKQGKKISWNKEFVESVIKSDFPEIYNDVSYEVKRSERESIITPSYTAGDNKRLFQVYGKNAFGVNLYGFSCDVSWSWDSTKLTNVAPYTWGEPFAPGWKYEGLAHSEQTMVSSTRCNIDKRGHFSLYIGDYVIQHGYPWFDINVLAGGGSNYNSQG